MPKPERGPEAFSYYLSAGDCSFRRETSKSGQWRSLLSEGNRGADFVRAGVRAGDTIFPIHVHQKSVYLLGRMMVASVIQDRVTDRLVGAVGSRMTFDLVVPMEILGRWRFASGRAVKYIEDGEIRKASSLIGIYRLSKETAQDLFDLLLDHSAIPNLTG
jgi:hypothetical protein